LKQVEKTVSGQPISPAQFEAIILDVRKALEINKNDRVLDMCCGNGVITAEIAKACDSILGIDYSEPLIKIAKKYNQSDNTAYYHMSVLDQNLINLVDRLFTKIYMYEALQHFTEKDLIKILDLIREISTPDAVIFFGSVPDLDKIWDFYNTDERREDYRIRKSKNEEAIGTWWNRKTIEEICLQRGFELKFLAQNQLLHSAHYRFDFCLVKQSR
jgi:2-polyprenyl-3-methyl-5-hydroxy-6-metoxy-1,4-benzoquinol methylase